VLLECRHDMDDMGKIPIPLICGSRFSPAYAGANVCDNGNSGFWMVHEGGFWFVYWISVTM